MKRESKSLEQKEARESIVSPILLVPEKTAIDEAYFLLRDGHSIVNRGNQCIVPNKEITIEQCHEIS